MQNSIALQIQFPQTPGELYAWAPWYFIAIIIFIALWIIWTMVAPAEKGMILGLFSVVGRISGTRFHRIFRGTLVDCTDTFIGSYIDRPFRTFLLEAIADRLQAEGDTQAKERLSRAADWIYHYPLKRFCRIIATRFANRRHYFIQIYNVRKRLDAYASVSLKPWWSWAFGFLNRGVINGVIWSIPNNIQTTWRFRGKQAKARWHFYCPDDYEALDRTMPPPYLAFAEAIAAIQPFSRTVSEVKVLRRRVGQAERGRDLALQERSTQATIVDGTLNILKGFGVEGKFPFAQRRFSMNDLVMTMVGLIIGGGGMTYLRPNDPMMSLLGGAIGAALVLGFLGGR